MRERLREGLELKEKIRRILKEKVRDFGIKRKIAYRDPQLGFSSVQNELYKHVKDYVHENHLHPSEILDRAETAVSFAVPLSERAVEENKYGGTGSFRWAYEYVETNRLLETIGREITKYLDRKGFKCVQIKPTGQWNKNLLSTWSHKYAAYVSGLGKFGIHRLLITRKGTAVRMGTVLTEAWIPQTEAPQEEYCLEKKGVSCRICIERCPVNAFENWDLKGKFKCYENCLRTHERYGEKLKGKADCCGKCISGTPCALGIPK